MSKNEWEVEGNLWMVVNEENHSVIYGCAAPDRVKAYEQAGKFLAEPPYTTKQLREMGYKAVKVTELSFT